MKMKKARLALYITLACLLVASALGTAYAKYTSEPLEETFNVYVTAGTVELSVSDDNSNILLVPGTTIDLSDKAPTVNVKKGSEDCFVFVKVTKSSYITDTNTTDGKDFVEISAIDRLWMPLTYINASGETVIIPDVYFMEIDKAVNDAKVTDPSKHAVYGILTDPTTAISISHEATKSWIENIGAVDNATGETNTATITFTAYAVQKTIGIETPIAAWNALSQTN